MKKGYSPSQRLSLLIARTLGPVLVLLYGMTWRVRWIGEENLESARKIAGKVIYIFWHSNLLGLCYTHRFRGAGGMMANSYDGDLAAAIVERLGYRIFRGSASRDGAKALLEMIKSGDSCDLALTVDGPRGPANRVKPGALILASKSGLPLIPIKITASRSWRLRSWDRHFIPKPFSLVQVMIGKPIVISPDMTEADLQRLEIEVGGSIARIG